MPRTLPTIATLAGDVARMLGGSARVLDDGAHGSAAVAFEGWHRVLIRDHVRSVTISMPTRGHWSPETPEELHRIEPELRAALRLPRTSSLSDAIAMLAPVAERFANGLWQVRFPGTPIPAESWMTHGEHGIGLFQEARSVRVVVWAELRKIETSADSPSALAALGPWLESALRDQTVSLEATRLENARRAALPLPDFDTVIAHLTNGARIQVGGGRWHQTFFWDGRLRHEVFDEGHTFVKDALESDLRLAIESSPGSFRQALGLPV